MAVASTPFLKREQLPSRGRALVASQALLPGQILLQESPLLLYLDAEATASTPFCFHCTRICPNPTNCPSCQVAHFCSPSCLFASASSSHTPFVCKALSLLVLCTLDFDCQTQARFLIAAYNLAVVSAPSFEQLLLLEGEGVVNDRVHLVFTFLSEAVRSSQLECQSLPTWSIEFVASLLAKDQRNAFGLIAPLTSPGDRQVRAYAIYAQASFLNHDCLPNACRFEYIDKPGANNTEIIIRALHEISEGAEVCISYFPVNWQRAVRQKKLKEEYGFECECERCKVEETWVDDDQEHADDIPVEGDGVEGDEEMEVSEEEEMDAEEHDLQGGFPHAMFFVKYLCPNEGCGGTMAPLPPSEEGISSTMECNVCGELQAEAALLEDVEEHRIAS